MAAAESSVNVSALLRRDSGDQPNDVKGKEQTSKALHQDAYSPPVPKAVDAPVAPILSAAPGGKTIDATAPTGITGFDKLNAVHDMPAKAVNAEAIESAAPGVKAPRVDATVGDALGGHTSFTVSDMLYREKYVLGGVTETVNGIKDRAAETVHDWKLTTFELVSGVALGSAMVLASRNPALAGGMKVVNRAMLGIAATDLVSRVAIPSIDALMHPENLEADRKDLGNRLGSAVVDYSMAAVGGGIGSRAFTPVLERTGVGSMLSGYDFLKTPAAEVRVFKATGNALITKNGVRVFRPADMDFDTLDPLAEPRGLVGNNDLLRRTFEAAENNPNGWRAGKDIAESYGKFATWFETVSGALTSELVERSADVGMGLIEHNYLVKTLEHPTEHASEGPKSSDHHEDAAAKRE